MTSPDCAGAKASICTSSFRRCTSYITSSPIRQQVAQMHTALEEIAAKWDNVRLYSYFNDNRFDDDDFHSGNHLSADIGAHKVYADTAT